jgi:hypothetical protein
MGGVLLDPNGGSRINDERSLTPTTCDSLVLLIRNAANLTWFVVYPRIYSTDAKLCTLALCR